MGDCGLVLDDPKHQSDLRRGYICPMADEVNEGSDKVRISDRTEHTSKHTADEAVSDSERAERYEQRFTTFSDNDRDQSFKAIQPAADTFGIDFGDGTIETAKGKVEKPHTQEFFESKAQGAMTAIQNLDQQPKYAPDQLIAANVTPNNPVMSDATLPTSEAPREEVVSETKISQGLPNDYDAHTFFESGEALKPAVEAAGDLGKAVIERGLEAGKQAIENATHPFRGKIESTMKQIPEANWSSAYDAFPQFKSAGLSKQQSIDVMKAIVRNELYNYDTLDEEADEAVKKGDSPLLAKAKIKPENKLTLGITQISTQGIFERQAEFPKQVNFKGHEQKALLEPKNAPVIVAATLAHNIEMYQRHKVPITEQTLAYSYNPADGKVLPESLNGDHVRNVMHQLGIIRGEIEPNPNER